MATTITAATLTVNLSETLTLGGQNFGGTKELTISNITEAFKRIVRCMNSQTTTIATFSGNAFASANAIDLEDAKYIRVTNLDDTNPVELAVVGAATLYQVRLDAGQSHILGAPDDLMLAEADTSPSFGTMADIASIQVNPASNDVDVEIFVAGI
jgi:hypothetical protein|tara:strand:+ start:116 stop:580 length:465 start_codon:yes stop_codon:yes gene_type:complete